MKETRRGDLVLVAGTSGVFILVAFFAPLETALAAAVTFGVFAAIVQTKWESRNDWRFWAIIAFFAALHLVVLAIIRFPAPKIGLVSVPFALADSFAMYWILNWVERRYPRAADIQPD